MNKAAFYFGPVQQDFRDAFLLSELIALGGIPFVLGADGQKQAFVKADAHLPLLLLDPFIRKIPDLLWQQALPKAALIFNEKQPLLPLSSLVSKAHSLFELGIGQCHQQHQKEPARIQRLYIFDPYKAQLLHAAQQGNFSFDFAMPLDYSVENFTLMAHAQEIILDLSKHNFLHYLLRSRHCGLWLPDLEEPLPKDWQSEAKLCGDLTLTYVPPSSLDWPITIQLADFVQNLLGSEVIQCSQKDLAHYHALMSAPEKPWPYFKVPHFAWLSRLPNAQKEQAAYLQGLPLAPTEMYWVLAGPFGRPESLAGINQKWAEQFKRDGLAYVQISDYLPYTQAPEPRTELFKRPRFWLSHHFPPLLQRPDVEKWAVIQPWEFGDIPAEWQILCEQSDALWPPSRYVADAFLRAGARLSQLQVIPNGVDTSLYQWKRQSAAGSVTRFLSVTDYAGRKGLDILIRAFQTAFEPQDQVELVIKVLGSSLYNLNAERSQIQHLLQQCEDLNIQLISENYSATEMAELYQSADFYVHPYRGEGFGMPILEAMACGLPVMVTAGGPSLEFCPPESFWIPAQWLEFPEEIPQIGPAVECYWYFEPDQKALSELLQQALKMPLEERRRLGKLSRQQAEAYDWQIIQKNFTQAAQALMKKSSTQVSPTQLKLSWQIADVHLSELAPVEWSWLGPEQAEGWVVEPGTISAEKQLIYWADAYLPNPDPDALWLAADPAIREHLITQGVPVENLGLLQAQPCNQQEIAPVWQDVLSELEAHDFCCLAYQDHWGDGSLQKLSWWLPVWFEAILSFPETNQPWLILAGPESELPHIENALEQLFDALQPPCMPRVILVAEHSRRPPKELFEHIAAYFALDQNPNLHWVQAAGQQASTRVYACGGMLPCSAPYAIPVPRANAAFLDWHFRHLHRNWPRRVGPCVVKQELPARLLSLLF